MNSGLQPLALRGWQRNFYAGERLKAEIELLAAHLKRDCPRSELLWVVCRHLSTTAGLKGAVVSVIC